MTTPEERLQALGLELPNAVKVPDGLHLPFAFVNVRGDRAIFSGHPRQDEREPLQDRMAFWVAT
jgi:hypothetical protein